MQTYAQEIVAPNRDRALAEILGHRVYGMVHDEGKKESEMGARIARRMLQKHKQSPLADILQYQKRRRSQK
jgi:hypothetical protein